MSAYIVWTLDPEIIEGIVFFRWYGLCWLLGMVTAYAIMRAIYNAEGVAAEKLDKLTTYLVLGIILGARLGHVLFYDPVYYWHNPIEILPFRISPTVEFTGFAGLASHGGVLGALLALFLYNRKYRQGYTWLLDRLTIAAAALGGFIRVGNLMNSEIIGVPSDMPWAFVFTRIDHTPRHPAQLYEALFYFAISITLYLIWKSKRFTAYHGFLFGLGLTLMFSQRFVVEFLKENQVAFEEGLALNMGQVLSIPLVLVGVAVMVGSSRRAGTT